MQQQTMESPHGIAKSTPLPDWSKVTITAQDAGGREYGPFEMAPGKVQNLPDSDLKLRCNEFYTHWNWNMRAINLSREEQNPAVKVEVLRGDSLLYHGWGFRNIPFFRMGAMGAHDGSVDRERLAFTLLSYEGVKFLK
jgi:hypothetical protein